MGCKAIMRYARANKLYEAVYLVEIADEHRRKTGKEPVIAVDGIGCVLYLYRNLEFCCGGQYKEFREACRNFVQKFSNCGVRLMFFFPELTPVEEREKLVTISGDGRKEGKINQAVQKNDESDDAEQAFKRLPESLIPCARVFFRDEQSAEVHLCTENYKLETAQYAVTCKSCLGVMSSNGSILMYKDVPCMFTLDKDLQVDDEVRLLRFRPAEIASHLDIQHRDLPACATFLGNDTCGPDEMRRVHGRLGNIYGRKKHLASLIAEQVRNNTVEGMCRVAFDYKWREFLDAVKTKIDHYNYKPRASEETSEQSSSSDVLLWITAKHRSGDIPPVLLSVTKCHINQIVDALEDLHHDRNDYMLPGGALQRMRRRMYTVLLWESGDGPFYVEEVVGRRTMGYRILVEVQKRLPPSVTHPGLLKLWTGDLDTRWRLFSWIVGSPDPEGSALSSLEPQCLVVPAAALSFLRHEARLLSPQEAEIFAVVAATVSLFSPQELAQRHPPELDPHAVFLSTLFVRTALHILDAAAVCGLSFPREADCQLDAYFDGKFFHDLYLKAKAQSFPRVGTQVPYNPSYLSPIHKLLNVIESKQPH